MQDLLTKHNLVAPVCDGRIYRYHKNYYRKGDTIVAADHFRLLRKVSCSGCEICAPLEDMIDENIDDIIIPEIKTGSSVQFKVINLSYDRETGLEDGYDLIVEEVEI